MPRNVHFGGSEFVVISLTVSGFKIRTPSSSPPLSSIWQKRRKSGTVETMPPPPEKNVCGLLTSLFAKGGWGCAPARRRDGQACPAVREAAIDHMQRREEAALQKLIEGLSRHDFNDAAEHVVADGIFQTSPGWCRSGRAPRLATKSAIGLSRRNGAWRRTVRESRHSQIRDRRSSGEA